MKLSVMCVSNAPHIRSYLYILKRVDIAINKVTCLRDIDFGCICAMMPRAQL